MSNVKFILLKQFSAKNLIEMVCYSKKKKTWYLLM